MEIKKANQLINRMQFILQTAILQIYVHVVQLSSQGRRLRTRIESIPFYSIVYLWSIFQYIYVNKFYKVKCA